MTPLNHSIQRMGASRLAPAVFAAQRRLAPTADAERSAVSDRRATVDCFGREEREAVKQKRKQMKVPKAEQSTLKPVGFIAELRAALKPARKKSKRNKSNPYQVNSGRLSCRDFGLI